MNHIIIYSHGFGVRRDSRGMFTDIAAGLPHVESILFDYCRVDPNNDTQVPPLPDQAAMLNAVIGKARAKNPSATIDLICHSQGSTVAGLARPQGVHKIILLAPSADVSAERHAQRLSKRTGKDITTATTQLERRDGTTTFLTPAYWNSLNGLDVMQLYNDLAEHAETYAVCANQEDMVDDADFSALSPHICAMCIDGNHNFDDDARPELIKLIKKILTL
jgi:Alpha/beta hydrolase